MFKKYTLSFLLVVSQFCVTTATNEVTNLGLSPEKIETQILTDNEAVYATHSIFLNDLRERGHHLTLKFQSSEDIISKKVSLMEDGEYVYENIILITTSLEDLTKSEVFDLHDFFDKGGNIFFIGDYDTSDKFKELANGFGFNLDRAGSYTIDYQKAYKKGQPNLFWANNYKEFPFLSKGINSDLQYNGISLTFTHFETDQITVFLRGNTHSASIYYDEVHGKNFNNLGKNAVLVAGIQGINHARVVASGSLDMFSDELFSKSKQANRKFAMNLVDWMSHKIGYLRVKNNRGTCVDQNNEPSDCPVRSNFIYDLEIDEWDTERGSWKPYSAYDVYFKLYFMDEKINKKMERVSEGKYHVSAQVPDRMGTYTMSLKYNRPGYNIITCEDKIFVRPWHYKENVRDWDRDSASALGVGVIFLGFTVVSLLFLYDKSRNC